MYMLVNGVKFTLGADPEVFVKRGDQFISAFNMIPGDKENPHKVDKGAVQVDGMALEFNIDPCVDRLQWNQHLTGVMHILERMIPEDMRLDLSATANFGADYIKRQPLNARRLGCDPDFNAYTGLENPAPDAEMPFRTAAGHIHVGWTEDQDIDHPDHQDACRMLVKCMDKHLGVPSVFYDKDKQRRMLYGKAGAYRAKPYGVEYRVLSNAWLKSRHLRDFVYNQTQRAITEAFTNTKFKMIPRLPNVLNFAKEYTPRDVINNSRTKVAEAYLEFTGDVWKGQFDV